jgi:FlaA1/EpsC-like NDP-sugar epimerase
MTILIKELSDEEFQVTVNEKNSTSHKVTLTDDVHQNLTNGKVSKKELIEFSFKFLLEREPNTSILSSFELSVISGYFPEYIKTVKEWSAKN